jgi:hypothetical protein
MLLWEALRFDTPKTIKHEQSNASVKTAARLPYETQCAALTKSGRRCRGKILRHSEFCLFHDPKVAAKRRQSLTNGGASGRRRLSQLPGGYLRKLSTRTSVGTAMDRLYREIRLGMITPEMGKVLFGILTRIADTELTLTSSVKPNGRARADVLRPRISEALTRAERAAWRRAVANVPDGLLESNSNQARTDDLSDRRKWVAEEAQPRYNLAGTTPIAAAATT